jgi:hypothetical protein
MTIKLDVTRLLGFSVAKPGAKLGGTKRYGAKVGPAKAHGAKIGVSKVRKA